jgi:hypothetical protein
VVEVKRPVILVALAILLIGLVLLGLSDTVPFRWSSWPSEADVEEAVLRDIAGENGPSVFHSQWVTEVEVVEYGEPCIDKLAMMRQYICWPVKVYFIGDQQRVQRIVWLNKGPFGEWRVVVRPQCY